MAASLAAFERDHRVEEPAYADLQHEFEILGGYTLDQRVDEALSGLGFSRDEWVQAADGAVGRRADPRGARPTRHRRSGPAAPRRADEPPRHRRPRVDRGAPPAAPRLAPRRVARPGVPRRDRHPDLGAARPPPDGVPRRLQRLPPPARRARRAGGQGRRGPGRARSSARRSSSSATGRTASSARCTSTRRGSSGSRRSGSRRRRARRKLRLPGAALAGGGPSRSGEVVVRIEDLVVGYLPGRGAVTADGSPATEAQRVARAPFLAAQRGDRIGIVGPNGAGQDDAPPDDRRRPAADRRPAVVRQRRPDRLPRPAPRRGDPGRDGHRRAARGDPDHAGRGARLPRPVPVPRRRRVQGGPGAVGRRAVAARAGAARDHAVEPAPARRADEPPRHSRPARRSRRS